ncbi:hypothetical protein [Dactylosporangium sp. CA-092794]|uniref:hypothetical protein n=1 Tax=Dactylosporangium sp. CA-092794 TaxID=3239929 RepID=UPI003D934172
MGRHDYRRMATSRVVADPSGPTPAPWWVWLLPPAGFGLWVWSPLAGLLVAVGLAVAVEGFRRYRSRNGIRLVGARAREWDDAAVLLGEIRRCWPSLGAMAEPADIRPTLARTGYQLAKLIAARARLSLQARQLQAVRAELVGGRLRDEVDERYDAVADRLRELDAVFAARVVALGRLAASLRTHERAERVRELLVSGLEPVPEAGPDPLAEVAGRTAVRLEAYRELSELRPLRSET